MNNSNFVHLHVHTEHSYLDGMSKITELVSRAKELGQQAIAITDHGNCDGLYKFQKECVKQGIKPILGEEFYFLNGYNDKGKPIRGHLIILCKNEIGLNNLYKLQEKAYIDNFYMKPMITFEMLETYHEGLICMSACLANIIPQSILHGKYLDARKYINRFVKIFGDDFYLEIQPNSLKEQVIVNNELISLSKELNIKLIATNDVHYVYKEDFDVHEVLLAISTNKKMSDEKRFKFPNNDFWLKSENEMKEGFKNYDENIIRMAINNTKDIVNKCNCTICSGHYLPTYPFTPSDKSSDYYFTKKVFEGYKCRKVEEQSIDTKEYIEEIEKEIKVICNEGYSDYFLIVQDYINRIRNAGIFVGDGRGSGAGSKCCYCMDITRIEPKQYDLLFERFLAPNRVPDIDTDVSDIDKSFEVIAEAYQWNNVARIISFGTFAPRAITRRVLSIFNHPQWKINNICKLLPDKPGLKWSDVITNEKYIKEISKYKREWKCIQRLQGNVSHTSMHAGGIVIWDNISDILPVKTINNLSNKRIKRVVCFDMDDLHELGVFKFDVLGLSTLETLEMAVNNVENLHGIHLDLNKINYEDKAVLSDISNGNVAGIFQLSEQPQIALNMKPKTFRDIIVYNAIIRPGDYSDYYDKRNGLVKMEDLNNRKWMIETHGEYVYQEQYLLDCKYFAGWDIAYADKHVRKNKDIYSDIELKNKFINDSISKGFNKVLVTKIWNKICKAVDSGYSFNKSHAACYSRTAYQEAYIRHYYPECFYSALLTKHGDNQEKVGAYISECKRNKIEILPPSINESESSFLPIDRNKISFRLSTIKGLGDNAIREIKKLRPIQGLEDLLSRRSRQKLNNSNIVALIKAGAFDFEEPNRAKELHKLLMANRKKTEVKNNIIPDMPEYNKAKWEFESLGIFLTEHILDKYAFKSLTEFNENDKCLVAGVVIKNRIFNDKNGHEMAFVQIDNQFETIKLVIFASTWKKEYADIVQEDNIIYAKGKRDNMSVICNSIHFIDKI